MNNPIPSQFTESKIEKLSLFWETIRLWLTQAWRIAFLMAKGAYLTQERKNLFQKLGEDVYYKIQKGELRNTELQDLVKDIERFTKKLEISEIRIRSVRFGQKVSENTSNPSPSLNGEIP